MHKAKGNKVKLTTGLGAVGAIVGGIATGGLGYAVVGGVAAGAAGYGIGKSN